MLKTQNCILVNSSTAKNNNCRYPFFCKTLLFLKIVVQSENAGFVSFTKVQFLRFCVLVGTSTDILGVLSHFKHCRWSQYVPSKLEPTRPQHEFWY
jgi:hypothetical protein